MIRGLDDCEASGPRSVHRTVQVSPGSQAAGSQEVALSLAAQAWTLLGGLAGQSLLAYTLLPEGRGAYAVCMLFGNLMGLSFTPGAGRGSQYFMMSRNISVSQGVAASLVICLAGSGMAIALAIPLINSDISFFQKAEPGSFYLALALIPITSFSSAMQMQLAGLRQFAQLAILTAVQAAAGLLSLVALVLWLGLGVEGALASFAIGQTVLILGCVRNLRKGFGLSAEMPKRSTLRTVTEYGIRYHPAQIGHAIDLKAGILLLGFLAAQADIGIFSTASGLMVQFFVIGIAMGAVLLPRVAGDRNGRPELVSRCFRISGIATGCAVVAVLLVSAPLVPIVFSEAFRPMLPLFWIMMPGIIANGAAGMFITYFRGTNRPGVCSWAIWLGLTANVVTLIVLYPLLGVSAAAWGLTAGLIVRSTFVTMVYWKVVGLAWSSIFAPQKEDVRLLIASGRLMFKRTAG